MSGPFVTVLVGLCEVIVLTTVLHAVVTISVVLFRRLEGGAVEPVTPLPPVTWLRPIKPGVSELSAKLMKFVSAIGPEDQVLIALNAGSADRATCEAVAASSGGRVEIVECEPSAVLNPKIAKLVQLVPRAKHDRWILADAEADFDAAFVSDFRHEWEASGANVLTAGYRMIGQRSICQRLDSMAVLVTLWPGLELVRAFGRIGFTLGACTGFRHADLAAVGGWEAFANDLAEDHRLGESLVKMGAQIRLAKAILPLDSDPISWRDYLRHQVRVAVTYRCATPAGAAGMILTRGISMGALGLLLHPSMVTTIGLTMALTARTILAHVMQRATRSEWPFTDSICVADFVETAAWFTSWFSHAVWWGGRWRRIDWRGKLQP